MNAHIAIIEDNQANLELARYLLECSGYRVSVASDGEQGIKLVLDEQPDLVICDLQMPGIDGYQVLERIRECPELARMPVIAVTAFSMPNDRQKVISAGFDSYVSKPIDPEDFVRHIGAFLPPEFRRQLPRVAD